MALKKSRTCSRESLSTLKPPVTVGNNDSRAGGNLVRSFGILDASPRLGGREKLEVGTGCEKLRNGNAIESNTMAVIKRMIFVVCMTGSNICVALCAETPWLNES